MDSIEASLLTLKFEVSRLAQEMPDFKYEIPVGLYSCYYSKGGCSLYPESIGCIIGQAARNVWPEFYQSIITIDGGAFSTEFYEYHLYKYNRRILDGRSYDIFVWLSLIQTKQDAGCTWRQSLDSVS